jgi:hypothetical protein
LRADGGRFGGYSPLLTALAARLQPTDLTIMAADITHIDDSKVDINVDEKLKPSLEKMLK